MTMNDMELSNNIKELKTRHDWLEAYPVMNQLRTGISEADYLNTVEAMSSEGYKMFALYDCGKIVSVAGIILLTNLVYGKYIWVHDLVTDSNHRSKGYGNELLSYMQKWAKQNNVEVIALSSGLQRTDAHKFYESKMGYDKTSYVFKKQL